MRVALTLSFLALAPLAVMLAQPRGVDPAAQEQTLPRIAPAPEFALTSQDGAPVSLGAFVLFAILALGARLLSRRRIASRTQGAPPPA